MVIGDWWGWSRGWGWVLRWGEGLWRWWRGGGLGWCVDYDVVCSIGFGNCWCWIVEVDYMGMDIYWWV